MNLSHLSRYILTINPHTSSVRTRRIIKKYGPIFEYKDVKKTYEEFDLYSKDLFYFISISHGWNGFIPLEEIFIENYNGSIFKSTFNES